MMTRRHVNAPTLVKRFECIDPERNHNKFYELTAEMLLFGPTVTRRWGRIGSRRPRILSKDYETWEEAKREIKAILSPAYSCILVPIMNNPPFGELRINPVGFAQG